MRIGDQAWGRKPNNWLIKLHSRFAALTTTRRHNGLRTSRGVSESSSSGRWLQKATASPPNLCREPPETQMLSLQPNKKRPCALAALGAESTSCSCGLHKSKGGKHGKGKPPIATWLVFQMSTGCWHPKNPKETPPGRGGSGGLLCGYWALFLVGCFGGIGRRCGTLPGRDNGGLEGGRSQNVFSESTENTKNTKTIRNYEKKTNPVLGGFLSQLVLPHTPQTRELGVMALAFTQM